MWVAAVHTDEENLRWAWLRAVEWRDWPVFLSQVLVPPLLCLYPWAWVLGGLVVLTIAWRALVATWWVSMVADLAPMFVLLKFIAAPASAYILWHRMGPALAIVALVWPWLGPLAIGLVLAIPGMFLEHLTPLGKLAMVGPVQRRFMAMLGYSELPTAG
jgi:hypothetical protein